MTYFQMPLKWNAITTYFSSNHLAVDFGWNNDKGGPNVAVYSCSDGVVVFAGQTGGTAGTMVKVRYDDAKSNITWYFQYKHLSKIAVKKGDKITRNTQIGNMGGTGGYAPHLHLDVIKCPYMYEYEQEKGDDRKTYSVNPLDYCFLYPYQTTNEKSKSKIDRLYGSDFKVAKNSKKDQVEVVGYKLRVRAKPGLNEEILGYIDYGYYNVLDTTKKDNYTWYKLKENLYIANVKTDTKYYPKTEDSVITCEEKLTKLTEQNTLLETQNNLLKAENDKLKEQLKENNSENNNLKEFIALKDGYYYIYLMENEKVYYN